MFLTVPFASWRQIHSILVQRFRADCVFTVDCFHNEAAMLTQKKNDLFLCTSSCEPITHLISLAWPAVVQTCQHTANQILPRESLKKKQVSCGQASLFFFVVRFTAVRWMDAAARSFHEFLQFASKSIMKRWALLLLHNRLSINSRWVRISIKRPVFFFFGTWIEPAAVCLLTCTVLPRKEVQIFTFKQHSTDR